MKGLDIVVLIGLGILAIIDIKKKKIPVWFVGIFSIIVLSMRFVEGIVLSDVMGGFFLGVLILILAVCSRENIGIGDGLVLCTLGIGYCLEDMIGILGISFFLAAIWAIGLVLLKRANKKTEFPFLPCLFTGYLFIVWIK